MRLIMLIALLLALPAQATTVEDLMANDRLRLKAWLDPESDIVVGQEVRMLIQVSTPRWFAGGTRITLPEVDGLVVLRRDEFATNLSRREAGTTWVIQQWQLELYPQREGRFTVPPVRLQLAVNEADAGIVRGELSTPTLSLSAAVPEPLRALSRWLATPSLSVEQTFDRELTGLEPGDAFTRTVEMRASRVTAMMLPEIPGSSLDGLAAYPEIPTLENRSNRGEATAIRQQQTTYVVESAGQYTLPALEFSWWNTDTGTLELATLPAVTVDAGVAGTARSEFRLPTLSPMYLMIPVALLALWLGYRQWRSFRGKPLTQARSALRRGDAHAATAALYRWLNTRPSNWLSLRDAAGAEEASEEAERLLRASYGPGEAEPDYGTGLIRRLRQRRAGAVSKPSLSLNPAQPRK